MTNLAERQAQLDEQVSQNVIQTSRQPQHTVLHRSIGKFQNGIIRFLKLLTDKNYFVKMSDNKSIQIR